MPWSTTTRERRRYFSRSGRGQDETTFPLAAEPCRGRSRPTRGTYAAIREYDELYGFGHAETVCRR
jgi:hypothetical protein